MSTSYTITESGPNIVCQFASGGRVYRWAPPNCTVIAASNVYFRVGDDKNALFLDWNDCTDPTAASKTLFLQALNDRVRDAPV